MKRMQFYDEVTIDVQSGKGGDGIVAGRRESGMPFGGPAGGNGGRGGAVIFIASKDENTLLPYKYKKKFVAKPGEPGRSKEQYGAHAEDLLLPIPIGTIVRDVDTGTVVAHFTEAGQKWTAGHGGEGGRGNMMFADSVRQYPQFALRGEPGQKKTLILELQLLGDVALIGTPSVGKSTIINSISNAKAKTADYHFTTLVPHLGSVQHKDHTFNVVDVPGLIAGAAEGKGLGNAFLRHILKARVFCFVADISKYDQGIKDIPLLLDEIVRYIQEKFVAVHYFADDIKEIKVEILPDEKHEMMQLVVHSVADDKEDILMKKMWHIVINKQDLVQDDDIVTEYKHSLRQAINHYLQKKGYTSLSDNILFHNTFVISAATHTYVDERLDHMTTMLDAVEAEDVFAVQPVEVDDVIHVSIEDITEIEKPKLIAENYMEEIEAKFLHVRAVVHPEIEKWAHMVLWGNDEAEMWFWQKLEEEGYMVRLHEGGIQKGDVLKIINHYAGEEDKYILY